MFRPKIGPQSTQPASAEQHRDSELGLAGLLPGCWPTLQDGEVPADRSMSELDHGWGAPPGAPYE